MAGPAWKNIYELSESQMGRLDEAEEEMQFMRINKAESLLISILVEDPNCIPALNNLAHLYGRYLSDFEKAIEYYDIDLKLEPENVWARNERRRYRRYSDYD